jgi:hypothetical protein
MLPFSQLMKEERMLRLLIVIVGWLVASPVYAYPMSSLGMPGATPSGGGCNATLVMNITLRGKSAADVQEQFDTRMMKLAEFIKQQKMNRFSLQSMNYNINTQPSSYGYGYAYQEPGAQLTSNATYMVESPETAFRLAEFLTQLQFIVNVNANHVSNAPCANTQEPPAAPASTPDEKPASTPGSDASDKSDDSKSTPSKK